MTLVWIDSDRISTFMPKSARVLGVSNGVPDQYAQVLGTKEWKAH